MAREPLYLFWPEEAVTTSSTVATIATLFFAAKPFRALIQLEDARERTSATPSSSVAATGNEVAR